MNFRCVLWLPRIIFWGGAGISESLAPPESVVYFSEVLDYYCTHRDSSRLLKPNISAELDQMLKRLPEPELGSQDS